MPVFLMLISLSAFANPKDYCSAVKVVETNNYKLAVKEVDRQMAKPLKIIKQLLAMITPEERVVLVKEGSDSRRLYEMDKRINKAAEKYVKSFTGCPDGYHFYSARNKCYNKEEDSVPPRHGEGMWTRLFRGENMEKRLRMAHEVVNSDGHYDVALEVVITDPKDEQRQIEEKIKSLYPAESLKAYLDKVLPEECLDSSDSSSVNDSDRDTKKEPRNPKLKPTTNGGSKH